MVPTASRSVAVQVVRYHNDRTTVVKHIGSGRNKEEVAALKQLAMEWIEQKSGQGRLFPQVRKKNDDNLLLCKYRYLGFRYGLIYETINSIFHHIGLEAGDFPRGQMFLDLVLARLVEPASKRVSQRLLASFFGINYSLTDIYRALVTFASFKDAVEERLISFARDNLGFDFSFVLYDITTLYFETFIQDEFRKAGFSKDNKIGQPQILVGLVVSRDGFPLSFSLFDGNKFEGHTLIPVILKFKVKHRLKSLTVIADAAMLSKANILALKQAGLNYIVGARLGNTSLPIIKDISQRLGRTDGACLKISTDDGFLICHFSSRRYAKDRHEMVKQLERARQILAGKREVSRNKFLSKDPTVKHFLNSALIEKTDLLLGIKGYRTNLDLPEKMVISRYQDLWRIEKDFRISKNDLEARPIYHFKKQTIAAHILICVTALAVLKWLEIVTEKSAKYVVDQLKMVTDARMLNLVTDKEVLMRSKIPDEVSLMLKKISPH